MKTFGVLLMLAILYGVTVTSCEAQSRYSYPAIIVEEINPPTLWEAIYHEVEDCVGMKKGRFKAIRWFVTPEPWGPADNLTWGLWHASGGQPRIVIAARDTGVVRHEALHDILWRNGFKPFRVPADSSNNPEHPMPPFGTCAKRAFP